MCLFITKGGTVNDRCEDRGGIINFTTRGASISRMINLYKDSLSRHEGFPEIVEVMSSFLMAGYDDIQD